MRVRVWPSLLVLIFINLSSLNIPSECLEEESMAGGNSVSGSAGPTSSIAEQTPQEPDHSTLIESSGPPPSEKDPPPASKPPEQRSQKEEEWFRDCHKRCTAQLIQCYSKLGISLISPSNLNNVNRAEIEKCKTVFSKCSAKCTEGAISGKPAATGAETKGSGFQKRKTEL